MLCGRTVLSINSYEKYLFIHGLAIVPFKIKSGKVTKKSILYSKLSCIELIILLFSLIATFWLSSASCQDGYINHKTSYIRRWKLFEVLHDYSDAVFAQQCESIF